jgi:hypothetical protein
MSASTRKLRLGPLPKTDSVKITLTCPLVLRRSWSAMLIILTVKVFQSCRNCFVSAAATKFGPRLGVRQFSIFRG